MDSIIARSVDTRLDILWGSSVLLGPNSYDQSDWIDVGDAAFCRELFIGKQSNPGMYQFEIDWSNDKTIVLITENIGIADNWLQVRPVGAKFARFRVRNTDPAMAFVHHQTFVNAR